MATSNTFETPHWIASVREIPAVLPSQGAYDANGPKPSSEDMGLKDPGNIIYVNLKQTKIPEKFKERLEEGTQMLQLTSQWLEIHAGQQAQARKVEGKLPTDSSDASSWKRSDYRAKVIDTLLNGNAAWLYKPYEGTQPKLQISAKKASFHLELLKAMLMGIVLPKTIVASLEEVFTGISELIVKTEKTAEDRAVWIMFQVFTYDVRRDDIIASLRNVKYSISQDMIKVCVGKSSYESITTDFTFYQNDYSFNEVTWGKVKGEIEKWINELAIKDIRQPITTEIPVD